MLPGYFHDAHFIEEKLRLWDLQCLNQACAWCRAEPGLALAVLGFASALIWVWESCLVCAQFTDEKLRLGATIKVPTVRESGSGHRERQLGFKDTCTDLLGLRPGPRNTVSPARSLTSAYPLSEEGQASWLLVAQCTVGSLKSSPLRPPPGDTALPCRPGPRCLVGLLVPAVLLVSLPATFSMRTCFLPVPLEPAASSCLGFCPPGESVRPTSPLYP